MVAAVEEEYLGISVKDQMELDRQISVGSIQQLNCFASGWRGQVHGERKQMA
jgi:hypothetical protein